MNDSERRAIEAEVGRRVAQVLVQMEQDALPVQPAPANLVFLTEPLAAPDQAVCCVRENFGDDVGYIAFGLTGTGGLAAETVTEDSAQALTERTAGSEGIILLAPGIESLLRLAKGECATLAEKLVLRALLWEKPVRLWLDFTPNARHRSPVFQSVADAVGALELMGMQVSVHPWVTGSGGIGPLHLVTEQDVQKLPPGAELLCAKDAVITPLARDRASQNQIRFRTVE
jgi:hypothetical protein